MLGKSASEMGWYVPSTKILHDYIVVCSFDTRIFSSRLIDDASKFTRKSLAPTISMDTIHERAILIKFYENRKFSLFPYNVRKNTLTE